MPPENIQCSVQSAQSLHISWEPPLLEGRNGIIQGYKVTYRSVSEWLGKSKHLFLIDILVFGSFNLLFYCCSHYR